MKKYPDCDRRKRMAACQAQSSKHAPSRQFNSANGEPHTKKWLGEMRAAGLRRAR